MSLSFPIPPVIVAIAKRLMCLLSGVPHRFFSRSRMNLANCLLSHCRMLRPPANASAAKAMYNGLPSVISLAIAITLSLFSGMFPPRFLITSHIVSHNHLSSILPSCSFPLLPNGYLHLPITSLPGPLPCDSRSIHSSLIFAEILDNRLPSRFVPTFCGKSIVSNSSSANLFSPSPTVSRSSSSILTGCSKLRWS